MSEDVIRLAAAAAQVLTAAMDTPQWEQARDGLAEAAGVGRPALEASRRRVLDVDEAERGDRVRQETADWRYELIGHLAADSRRVKAVDRWMWTLGDDSAPGVPRRWALPAALRRGKH